MTTDILIERLERDYPPGSFGAEVVRLHREAARLVGREIADEMAQACFAKLDAARDNALREFFEE